MAENDPPCYSTESKMRMDRIIFRGILIVVAFSMYMSLAWAVFQWRNPTANQMSYYRDFWSVATFRRLPEYQADRRP